MGGVKDTRAPCRCCLIHFVPVTVLEFNRIQDTRQRHGQKLLVVALGDASHQLLGTFWKLPRRSGQPEKTVNGGTTVSEGNTVFVKNFSEPFNTPAPSHTIPANVNIRANMSCADHTVFLNKGMVSIRKGRNATFAEFLKW